eukprot:TRINITY_DN5821_c0_g1_i1.p2 TRINITY_DN5821_c0_g1~~TRINITY_DN5821_c0_g1_i1.p2  ORF type:complete len:75 (+),score=5.99 TRINITY_DN5821_c0_g1_i1:547-771(+)
MALKYYERSTKIFLHSLELNTKLWGKRNPEVAHSLWGIGIGLLRGKHQALRIVKPFAQREREDGDEKHNLGRKG